MPPIGGIPRASAPASSAGALQAFHSSEAASAKPSVQRANVNLGTRAAAAATTAAAQTARQRVSSPTVKSAPKAKAPQIQFTPGMVAPSATIRAPHISAVKYGPSILSTLGNQIIHLPQSTLEGAIGLGVPALSSVGDLVTGNISGAEHNAIKVGTAVKGAVTSDPFYQATIGGQGPSALAKNPLGTILDLSAAYGLVGHGLGAVARVAPEGSALREAASMARTPHFLPTHEPVLDENGRVIGADVATTPTAVIQRGGSRNIFSRLIQRQFDEARGSTGLTIKGRAVQYEHELRKAVAVDHTAEQGQRIAQLRDLEKADKAAKPAGAEEQTAARFVIPYGTRGTGDVRLAAKMTRDEMASNPEVYGMTAKTSEANIRALDKVIAKPNLDTASIYDAVAKTAPVQADLERQMTDLAMKSGEHLQNADRAQYMQQLPGVHYVPKVAAEIDPRLVGEQKDALSVLRDKRASLKDAENQLAADKAVHSKVGAQITNTLNRLPVVYQNDRLMNDLIDKQKMVRESRVPTNQLNKAWIKEAQDGVKEAEKQWKLSVKRMKTQKLYGTLIEDHSVPAITRKGSDLYGMHLRPITEDDYQAALAKEPAGFVPSHVTARNFFRNRVKDLRSEAADGTPALAEAGRAALTGEALKAGDVNPNWGAITRSHMNTLNAISVERELQGFMARYADQMPYQTLTDAQREAEHVAAETGVRMSTITWKGAYRNVPKAALDELHKQFNADHPGRMRLLTRPNQFFRNTVLAMSTKLPIMHTVENTTRTALMEGDPIRAALRAPLDIARHVATRSAMRDMYGKDGLARYDAIWTPGGLSHSASGAIGEDAGRLSLDQPTAIKQAAVGFVRAAGQVPRTIIRFQRMLEKPAQYAALGAHERQLLQEWGHSWIEANTQVSKYAQDLARGMATPEDAARAAQFMHKVDGQYVAFTGNVRQALRFMPFGSWYSNAARLVFVTLPRDHPLFDALLQDEAQHMNPQWQQQHAGLPADMQASLNVGPNAWLDIGKFTPIGVQPATRTGIESTLQQLALPWISSPAANLIGKGPFMADLYGPNTPYGKSEPAFGGAANLAALESIAEEFGGPLNDISRAYFGHGGTEYNTDTPILHLAGIGSVAEKPGSQAQQKGPLAGILGPAVDRALDPFRPTTFGGTGATIAGTHALPALSGSAGSLSGLKSLPPLGGK